MALSPYEEVKANVSLVEEFEAKGMHLRPAGPGKFKCECPFHNEKTPSMFVNYGDMEYYYCFGCSASGDVIDFISNYDKISKIDALEYFRKKYNLKYVIDLDYDDLIGAEKIKRKIEDKKYISNYLDVINKSVYKFLKKSDSPKMDFLYLKSCLREVYQSLLDGNIQYFEYLRSRYLKQLIKAIEKEKENPTENEVLENEIT